MTALIEHILSFLLQLLQLGFGLLIVGWITLVFFMAVMAAKRAKDDGTITPSALRLAYSILFVGYLLDFVFNICMSIAFLELPKETTFTARAQRHIAARDGWRYVLANWFCKNLLDPFQVGGHCH